MDLLEILIKIAQEFYPEILAVVGLIAASMFGLKFKNIRRKIQQIYDLLGDLLFYLEDDELERHEIKSLVEQIYQIILY